MGALSIVAVTTIEEAVVAVGTGLVPAGTVGDTGFGIGVAAMVVAATVAGGAPCVEPTVGVSAMGLVRHAQHPAKITTVTAITFQLEVGRLISGPF